MKRRIALTAAGAVLAALAGCSSQHPAPMYGLNAANTGQSRCVGLSCAPVLAWQVQVQDATPFPRNLALSNTGLLYSPGDDLYAIRAADGTIAWREKDGNRDSCVALDGRGRLVTFEGGVFRARRADRGQLLWTGVPISASDGRPAKIGPDGSIYAPDIRGVVCAYGPDGTFRWKTEDYAGSEFPGLSPAIDAAGNIYFAGYSKLVSVDAQGRVRWTANARLQSWERSAMPPTASRVMLSPAGQVVAERNGYVEFRDAATGQIVTEFPAPGAPQAMDARGNLYFSGGEGIVKTDSAGRELWRFTRKYMDWPLVVDAEEKVYCATQQGDIVALSADGRQLWDLHVTDAYPVLGSCAPVIGPDGTIYILTRDGVGAIVSAPDWFVSIGYARPTALPARVGPGCMALAADVEAAPAPAGIVPGARVKVGTSKLSLRNEPVQLTVLVENARVLAVGPVSRDSKGKPRQSIAIEMPRDVAQQFLKICKGLDMNEFGLELSPPAPSWSPARLSPQAAELAKWRL